MSWIIDNPERVTAMRDQPVLRNLLITQGYHELSTGFARMLQHASSRMPSARPS